MNWNDERAAFERRAKNGVVSADIAFGGVPFSPPNSTWVRMQLQSGEGKRVTLGDDYQHFKFDGLCSFIICTPDAQGSAPGRKVADELSVLFHEALFWYNESGRIRCKVPALDDRGVYNGWYQINLRVPYTRDVIMIRDGSLLFNRVDQSGLILIP